MKIIPLSNTHQTAFILVATIWMLATITIVAGAFAVWVNRSLELVGQQAELTQSSLDMVSTKSTLLYLLSTQVKNQGGITLDTETTKRLPHTFFDPMSLSLPPITGIELKLDNRPYSGINTALFSMQDEAGLININSPNSFLLQQLLLAQGFSSKQKNALKDKLIDYIDEDDSNRVQGAESFHYIQQGLPVPPNKKLKSPLELVNVMGWKDVIKAKPSILDYLTAAKVSLININTADSFILQLLPNIGQNQAEIIIQVRNDNAFESLYVADKSTGLSLDILYESITTFPSTHTRLYLWHKNSRLIEQLSIQLTPSSKVGKPWKINSSFAIPKTLTDDNQQPVQPQTALFNSSISTAEN